MLCHYLFRAVITPLPILSQTTPDQWNSPSLVRQTEWTWAWGVSKAFPRFQSLWQTKGHPRPEREKATRPACDAAARDRAPGSLKKIFHRPPKGCWGGIQNTLRPKRKKKNGKKDRAHPRQGSHRVNPEPVPEKSPRPAI
ncbi:unnamed protein product [Caretta caretta]